jgi:hypothetical protein
VDVLPQLTEEMFEDFRLSFCCCKLLVFHEMKAKDHSGIAQMLGGFLVTTAWRVLRLRKEKTPTSYGR